MEKCANEIASRMRKKRTLITGSAKITLEKHFETEQKPSLEVMAKLADSLRMKKDVVRIWFCNRRHKEKSVKAITAVTPSSRIPDEMKDNLPESTGSLSSSL